jgi:hypothetical protein
LVKARRARLAVVGVDSPNSRGNPNAPQIGFYYQSQLVFTPLRKELQGFFLHYYASSAYSQKARKKEQYRQ